MDQYHSQDEESPGSQRMTPDEARALVRLWADRQGERERLASLPSIQDIADVLQIPPQEASLLLQEVRMRRAGAEQEEALRSMRQQVTTRPGVLIMAILVASLFFVGVLLFVFLAASAPVPPAPAIAAAVEVTPSAPVPPAPPTTPPPAAGAPAGNGPATEVPAPGAAPSASPSASPDR